MTAVACSASWRRKAIADRRQRLLDLTDPLRSGVPSHRARHPRGEHGLHDRGRVVEAREDLAVGGTDLVGTRRRFEGHRLVVPSEGSRQQARAIGEVAVDGAQRHPDSLGDRLHRQPVDPCFGHQVQDCVHDQLRGLLPAPFSQRRPGR